MRFVGEAADVCKFISDRRSVTGFTVVRCQVDVVRIIFQASSPNFSVLTVSFELTAVVVLGVSTVRFRIGRTDAEAFVFISRRQTETVTVRFNVAATVVFALILSSKVQTFNQTEESVLR